MIPTCDYWGRKYSLLSVVFLLTELQSYWRNRNNYSIKSYFLLHLIHGMYTYHKHWFNLSNSLTGNFTSQLWKSGKCVKVETPKWVWCRPLSFFLSSTTRKLNNPSICPLSSFHVFRTSFYCPDRFNKYISHKDFFCRSHCYSTQRNPHLTNRPSSSSI